MALWPVQRSRSPAPGMVLLLPRWFPPRIGGVESYLSLLYASVQHKTDVLVLAPNEVGGKARDLAHPQPRVKRISTGSSNRKTVVFGILLGSLRLAVTRNVDQVHCGHVLVGLVGLALRRVLGIPYVVIAYGTEIKAEGFRSWRRVVLSRADKVVAISSVTSDAVKSLGVDPERIVLIPPVVDCGAFRPDADSRLRFRKQFGLAPDDFVVLTVCRLTRNARHKGVDDLMAAVADLANDVPNLVLVIVGDGDDRRRLEARASDLDASDRIIFAGQVSLADLQAAYSSADVFVLANKPVPDEHRNTMEGFGIVLIEAAASGVPVIATTAGGAVDALDNNETGLLVSPGSPSELANAIRTLHCDPTLRLRMARNGIERARGLHAPSAGAGTLFLSVISPIRNQRLAGRKPSKIVE